MRKAHIDTVLTGSRLGKAIFTSDGRVLLNQGAEINARFLDKLREYGISEIYIDDEISQGIDIKEAICDQTRAEAKQLVKELMGKYTYSKTFELDEIKAIVDMIINELLTDTEVLINLSDIKSVDDYTFEHSVNVCILSLIIGIAFEYNADRLSELGIGAILHDIGKLMIPDEILKKPSQLTVEEFEEIKKHTVYGYEILKKNQKINPVSALIAYGHHERFDGSGYPLQVKGEDINEFARIVAVADVYDALTSDRVYRRKLRAHEVFEYITALGSHHFDLRVVDNFVKYISVYPLGTGVLLNTRERGLVSRINRRLPTRPVVRVVYDGANQKLKEFYDLDLSKKLNVFILDSCEI